MKKLFSTIFFLAVTHFVTSAQSFTGTIKPGTTATSVMVAIKASASVSNPISNVQFTVQIPNTVGTQPTVTILNNPLNSNVPTANYTTQVVDENGFYTYLFNATTSAAPAYSFTAGTEVDALELNFAGVNSSDMSSVRLSHLPSGGSTGQLGFYVEINGADLTDYTNTFYGTGAVNGGAYESYSYVPLGSSLPLKFLTFQAQKQNEDVKLNWNVDNITISCDHFEIERSNNGFNFEKIGNVAINNTIPSSSFEYTDVKVASHPNKGVFYYRIKQVDNNGAYMYSDVKIIRLSNKGVSMFANPNPASDYTMLSYDLPSSQSVSISLIDASSHVINTIKVIGNKGANQTKIPLTKYAAGKYLIKVATADESNTISIIKK